MTDTEQQTQWCIERAKQARAGPVTDAQPRGIHLEGLFLSAEYKGTMPDSLLCKGDAALFRRYRQAACDASRNITVSPEVEGVNRMIADISGEVTVTIDHSGANYDTACWAIANGVRGCTHTLMPWGCSVCIGPA